MQVNCFYNIHLLLFLSRRPVTGPMSTVAGKLLKDHVARTAVIAATGAPLLLDAPPGPGPVAAWMVTGRREEPPASP
jgi:hypothetical protein